MSWWKKLLGIDFKPKQVAPVVEAPVVPAKEPEVPLSKPKRKSTRKPKAPGNDGRTKNAKVKNRTKSVE